MIRLVGTGLVTTLLVLGGRAVAQEADPNDRSGAPAPDTVAFIGIEEPADAAADVMGRSVPIDPRERFQAGNSLYQAGDYEGALAAYTAILDAGYTSGDLHYNIGNAQFKLGRLGPAILSYERARKAMPSDENVLANLELARSLTADQITPLPGFWLTRVWNWWVDLLPRRVLLAAIAAAYLIAISLLVVRVAARGGGRRAATVGASIAGALLVVLALNLAIREFGIGRAEYGVVMVAETPVQSAPADDPGLQLFSIHEGTRVRVDRASDGWLEIVLEDGQVGWLRSTAIEII